MFVCFFSGSGRKVCCYIYHKKKKTKDQNQKRIHETALDKPRLHLPYLTLLIIREMILHFFFFFSFELLHKNQACFSQRVCLYGGKKEEEKSGEIWLYRYRYRYNNKSPSKGREASVEERCPWRRCFFFLSSLPIFFFFGWAGVLISLSPFL